MSIFDSFLSEDTKSRFDEAKELNELSEYITENARDDFETAQESCKKAIKKLDISKQKIYKGSMALFAISICKIHDASFSLPKELQEMNKYCDGVDFFYPYVDINTGMWESSLGRDVSAIVTSFSFGLVGGLAWREYMKKKSRVALDNAKAAYAQAEVVEEQLILATEVCGYIEKRTELFDDILDKLNKMFLPLVRSVESIIAANGTSYGNYSAREKQTIAACVSTALSIKSILDTAIIGKDGTLTLESKQMALNMSSKLQLECNAESLGDNECLPVDDDYELFSGSSNKKLIFCDTYDMIVKIICKELGIKKQSINMYTTLSELNASEKNITNIRQAIEKKIEVYIPKAEININSSIEDIADICIIKLDDTFKDVKFIANQVFESDTVKDIKKGVKTLFDLMRD